MKNKNTKHKIAILALILVLLAGSLVSVNAATDYTVKQNVSYNSGSTSRSAGALYYDRNSSYILAVYTGLYSGEACSTIAVTYKTNENGREITQYLDVNRDKVDDVVTASGAYDDAWFRNGTRYNTYVRLWANDSSDADGRYVAGSKSLHMADYMYSSVIKSILGGANSENISEYFGENVISSSEIFQSESTEYIRFQTDYTVSQFVKVDFIMESSGVSEWSLLGWDIYKVLEWQSGTSSEAANYAGPTIQLSDNSYLLYVGPDMTNYAYLSNRVALTMEAKSSGQIVNLVRGTYDANRTIGVSRGINMYSFVYSTASDYSGHVKSGTGSTTELITDTYLIEQINEDYSVSPTTLNFEIEFADEYGAGIESYFTSLYDSGENTSRTFPETLIATITYKNDKGFTEEVKVPVVSNTIVEALLTQNQSETKSGTAYNAVKENDVACFCQQGQTLCFHVDFPNYASLESVKIVYSNSIDALDAITIKQITVYDDTCAGSRYKYYQTGENGVLDLHIPTEAVYSSDDIETIYNDFDTWLVQYMNITDPTPYQRYIYKSKWESWLKTNTNSGSANGKVLQAGCTALYKNDTDDYNVSLDSATTVHLYKMQDADTVPDTKTNYNTTYLVTLSTSDVVTAGTTDKVYVQFAYVSTSGSELSSDEYEISETCKSYYGYNPGVVTYSGVAATSVYSSKDKTVQNATALNPDEDGNFNQTVALNNGKYENFICRESSYLYNMQQGEDISFFVNIKNLSRITGVKFRIESEASGSEVDDWQLDSIVVQTVESVSARECTHLDEASGAVTLDNLSIQNSFSRVVVGDIVYSAEGINLLIDNDEVQSLSAEENIISGDTDSDRDYSDYYYSMSYDIASSNLRFTTSSKTYQITVQVAGTKDLLTDDNAGSSNLYYFQLIFKNGMSGYVLANQQLLADGFRSGQEEVFYIYTNEDYGDLVSVRIIPDDVTEDSSKLDKLCIDNIKVLKQGSTGINKQYIINNVGWITPEYHDSSAEGAFEEGRSVSDMAYTYSVSSSSYLLELEFAISYDAYGTVNKTEVDNKGNITYKKEKTHQFEGQMKAVIEYLDSNGEVQKTGEIDVVSAMNLYDGLSSVTDSDGNIISNTSWMFRENTIDRFVVSLDDVSQLRSITLIGTSMYDTKLSITGLSVSIVTSEGRRYITSNSEYKKQYTTDPITLIDKITNRTLTEYFFFGANQPTSYEFDFDSTQGEIPSFEDETEFSMISRVPDSVNDTLNVYIYMQDGAVSPKTANQTLTTKVYYSSVSTGKSYISKITEYKEESQDGKIVLSATGVGATNMSTLNNVTIKANSSYDGALVDHVVIQQIRNDTIVSTFNLSLVGEDASTRIGISMMASNDAAKDVDKQIVTLQLSDDTQTSYLTSEVYDIAVSLLYTSELGDSTKTYNSPYVFLTDSGETSIKAGKICSFEFNQSNVKSIVGIDIVATNGLTAAVKCGNIRTYTTQDDGEDLLTGYLSMDTFTQLASTASRITMSSYSEESARTYKLATFKLSTQAESEILDSKGVYPIRMTIVYTDLNGISKTEVIEDIRNIVTSDSSFLEGGTATLQRMLKGVEKLDYAIIEPYNDDSGVLAVWNLDSLSFAVEDTVLSDEAKINVGKSVYEGQTNKISLTSAVIRMTVDYDGGNEVFYNENGSITIAKAGTVTISPDIYGNVSSTDFNSEVFSNLNGNGYIKISSVNDRKSGERIVLSIKGNETDIIQSYKVCITSAEDTAKSYSIIVNVTPDAKSEDEIDVSNKNWISLSLPYSISSSSTIVSAGTVESGSDNTKTVSTDSLAFDLKLTPEVASSASIVAPSSGIKYTRYVCKTGDGVYIADETRNIDSEDVLTIHEARNTSKECVNSYKYEFVSVEDSTKICTLIVNQAAKESNVVSLTYQAGTLSGTVKNNKKTVNLSADKVDIKATIGIENSDNSKVSYTVYSVDQNTGTTTVVKSGSGNASASSALTVDLSLDVNVSGASKQYEIYAVSDEDDSAVAQLYFVQEPVSVSLKYTVGDQSGTVSSLTGNKTIKISNESLSEVFGVAVGGISGSQSGKIEYITYSSYTSDTNNTVASAKSGEYQPSQTYNVSTEKNTSAASKKYYKVVASSASYPGVSVSLLIEQDVAEREVSIYCSDGISEFTVTNSEKEVVVSDTTTFTLKFSNDCYASNNKYTITTYFDNGGGGGFTEVNSNTLRNNIEYTLKMNKSEYNCDVMYKLEITSQEDSSKKAAIIFSLLKGGKKTAYDAVTASVVIGSNAYAVTNGELTVNITPPATVQYYASVTNAYYNKLDITYVGGTQNISKTITSGTRITGSVLKSVSTQTTYVLTATSSFDTSAKAKITLVCNPR